VVELATRPELNLEADNAMNSLDPLLVRGNGWRRRFPASEMLSTNAPGSLPGAFFMRRP
jgi:hypothetical protein